MGCELIEYQHDQNASQLIFILGWFLSWIRICQYCIRIKMWMKDKLFRGNFDYVVMKECIYCIAFHGDEHRSIQLLKAVIWPRQVKLQVAEAKNTREWLYICRNMFLFFSIPIHQRCITLKIFVNTVTPVNKDDFLNVDLSPDSSLIYIFQNNSEQRPPLYMEQFGCIKLLFVCTWYCTSKSGQSDGPLTLNEYMVS